MTSSPDERPEVDPQADPQSGPQSGPQAGPATGEATAAAGEQAEPASPADGPGPEGTTEATEVPAGAPTGATAPDGEERDELAEVQQALAERTADLQRLQAEYLNYKRRVDRDRDVIRENASFSVLSALLPVLDDIDRAREHGELTGGFKAVADSLVSVVTGLGLTKYGEKGDEFDPNVHEALMHGHSSEVSTTTVDVVAQPGYRVGDRVVRVAKVTVLDPED